MASDDTDGLSPCAAYKRALGELNPDGLSSREISRRSGDEVAPPTVRKVLTDSAKVRWSSAEVVLKVLGVDIEYYQRLWEACYGSEPRTGSLPVGEIIRSLEERNSEKKQALAELRREYDDLERTRNEDIADRDKKLEIAEAEIVTLRADAGAAATEIASLKRETNTFEQRLATVVSDRDQKMARTGTDRETAALDRKDLVTRLADAVDDAASAQRTDMGLQDTNRTLDKTFVERDQQIKELNDKSPSSADGVGGALKKTRSIGEALTRWRTTRRERRSQRAPGAPIRGRRRWLPIGSGALATVVLVLAVLYIGSPVASANGWSGNKPSYTTSILDGACSDGVCYLGVDDEWWVLAGVGPGGPPIYSDHYRTARATNASIPFYGLGGSLTIDNALCPGMTVAWKLSQGASGTSYASGVLAPGNPRADLTRLNNLPGLVSITLTAYRTDRSSCSGELHWNSPSMNFSPSRSGFDWSVSEQ